MVGCEIIRQLVFSCSYDLAEANMLYLETPVGVGFSYSTDSSAYVAVDDEATGMYLSTPKKRKKENKIEKKRKKEKKVYAPFCLTGKKKSFFFFNHAPFKTCTI